MEKIYDFCAVRARKQQMIAELIDYYSKMKDGTRAGIAVQNAYEHYYTHLPYRQLKAKHDEMCKEKSAKHQN